ncbi:class I SAM-dependent methyltransferase [uncultured Clostridium sp.]|uniref:class I SAM-dependent DNA methyltransferase n=1 Tax=uncultured Clostridium sp. TaxID=59620 RepID=UPI0025F0937C|nr:class I SAM-dependent methyltransferase [uncultured Clostridium sp.]
MSFDEKARMWDNPERIKRTEILSKAIIERIEDASEKTALEIGCGTGLFTTRLSKVLKEVACFDTSEEMVKVLKEKIKEGNLKNISIYTEEILNNEEFYEKFDIVYSSMVFHHIVDIEKEFELLSKLLKKSGQVIIIDLDEEDGSFHKNEKDFNGHNGFNRDEFKDILEKYGFMDVTFETVFNGTKIVLDKGVDYSLFLCVAQKC